MKLSVIILNYNVRYFLEQCLISVHRATADMEAEIIVVDNASEDDSCRFVKEKYPNVILVENAKNEGFSKGNNIGAQRAGGDFLCVLNPDTVIGEDAFKKAFTAFDADPLLGVLGVQLIDGSGNFLPESKRSIPTPKVAFLKLTGLYRRFSKWYLDDMDPGRSEVVETLPGAFMMLKKTVFEKINGFDEYFFMYGEDADLSFRVQKKGMKNYYFSSVKMVHYKGESTLKDKEFLKRFSNGVRLFYAKHYQGNGLSKSLLFTAIKVFSFFKLFRLKTFTGIKNIPKAYVFVSDREMNLEALKKVLKKEVVMVHKTALPDGKYKAGTEIIFDGNCLSNKEIIENISALKNKGYTFKILPENCNFILGSNYAESRGEVILIR